MKSLQSVMIYFAYGSNMFIPKLRIPVPSARLLCMATLVKHVLQFTKISKDGSGKCTANFTGNSSDQVHGLLFEIDSMEKKNLDDAEGKGYREVSVELDSSGGKFAAFTYLAKSSSVDNNLKPYAWYKEFIWRGAKEGALPESYIATIEAVDALTDPDQRREEEARSILNNAPPYL